jgi:hypothetical protein
MREYQSISSLQTFVDCPRCYWLHYIAGLDGESSPAQVLGSEVHEAIRDYHTHGTHSNELSEVGGKLYKVYVENVPQSILDEPEREFLVPLVNIVTGEKLPLPFKGIFDGISTKTGWIHEHKTASNYWKLEDINDNIQATGYAYAYFILFGKLPRGIRFNILKKNKITCKYQSLETWRTYEDLIYFFNWAKRIFEEIETSDFAPKQTRFNSHHKMCPYAGN